MGVVGVRVTRQLALVRVFEEFTAHPVRHDEARMRGGATGTMPAREPGEVPHAQAPSAAPTWMPHSRNLKSSMCAGRLK
jgi:hypothetical protein